MNTYNRSNSNWKTPHVEAVERNFNETVRFFANFEEQRMHGVKYVPQPISQ